MDAHGTALPGERLHIGIGLGSLHSTLRFDETYDVEIEMNTASVFASWQLNNDWSLNAGVGLILSGSFKPDFQLPSKVKPGGLAALGLEYQAIVGEGFTPFINFSATLSGSTTEIESPITMSKTDYVSSDLRLGARAGWNVRDRIFPTISARLFGGPVSWNLNGKDVTGTDIHHYQIAAGTAIQFGEIGTFVEWTWLGEKAFSLGMSFGL